MGGEIVGLRHRNMSSGEEHGLHVPLGTRREQTHAGLEEEYGRFKPGVSTAHERQQADWRALPATFYVPEPSDANAVILSPQGQRQMGQSMLRDWRRYYTSMALMGLTGLGVGLGLPIYLLPLIGLETYSFGAICVTGMLGASVGVAGFARASSLRYRDGNSRNADEIFPEISCRDFSSMYNEWRRLHGALKRSQDESCQKRRKQEIERLRPKVERALKISLSCHGIIDVDLLGRLSQLFVGSKKIPLPVFHKEVTSLLPLLANAPLIQNILYQDLRNWSNKYTPFGLKNAQTQRIEVDQLLSGKIGAESIGAIAKRILDALSQDLGSANAIAIMSVMPGGFSSFSTVMRALNFSGSLYAAVGALTEKVKKQSMDSERLYRAVHKLLMQESREAAKNFPSGIRQALNVLDDVHIKLALDKPCFPSARTLLLRRQSIYCSVPQRTIDLLGNERTRPAIDKEIADLIAYYPVFHREKLELLITSIRENSAKKKGVRVQVYLQGPPAIGKTHFVESLAKVLNVPLYKESGTNPAILQRIRGADDEFRDPIGNSEISDVQAVGLFAYAILESGCLNPIIFIDEAGPLLAGREDTFTYGNPHFFGARELLLEKMDPAKDQIALGKDGAFVDFSHATIILAGNQKMIEDQGIFSSRTRVIKFPILCKSIKPVIAEKYLQKNLRNHAGMTPQHTFKAEEIARRLFPKFIQEEEKHSIPGARYLDNALAQVVDHIAQSLRNTGEVNFSAAERIIENFYLESLRKTGGNHAN